MSTPRPISLPLATLYAELHDLTALDRPGRRRDGSFSVKTIHGRRYWYSQRWQGRRRIQKSLGPESKALLRQIAAWRAQNAAWREEQRRRRELCRALKGGIGMRVDRVAGRVLAELAERGLFQAGVVLVGTHAYMSYGPMLGRRLSAATLATNDLDIAVLDLALPAAPLSFVETVRRADEALLEVPPRPGSRLSTALKYKGAEFRVELLTPLAAGGRPWQPRRIPELGFAALAVPYLDYLVSDPVEATYLHDAGVRVRVPRPARYALHKLIVAASRGASHHSKAAKDLAQASALIEILAEDRPEDLDAAMSALARHPRAYGAYLVKGVRRLDPGVKARLPAALRAG
jgi:hypothetical protein